MIKYSIVDCEKLNKEDLAFINDHLRFYDTKAAIFHGERQIDDEKFHWTLQALTPQFFVCWFSLPCPVSFVVSSANATTARCAFEMAFDGVVKFFQFASKLEETKIKMRTPRFTPGPWEVNAYRDFFQVTDAHGNEICYMDEIYNYDECAANARLIAAAPEMHAMLKELATCGCIPNSMYVRRIKQLLVDENDQKDNKNELGA